MNEDNNTTVLPPITDGENTTTVIPDSISIVIPGSDMVTAPTGKEIMIGVGILLVLAVLFFFIRNAFVNFLVGPNMKRSPNNAGLAGWGLFGGLFFGSAIGCIAIISTELLTLALTVPLSLLSIICFGLALFVAMKK